MDKILLSYNDSCLYESDIEILKSETAWLNDRIISFYFEYLQRDVYESEEIILIGPEVTQLMKMSNPKEIDEIILSPLNIRSKNFILLAVNDNESSQVSGGTHWTLCLYSKIDNAFYHFDSLSHTNYNACLKLVKIMNSCLSTSAEIINVDCLQQNNCYDCGIFVLCHADCVCKTIMKSKSLSDIKKISYKNVAVKRAELLDIITFLSK